MDVQIHIDTTELQRVFKEYRKVSTLGLAEDVNAQAYYICTAAYALTKQADRDEINREIGPTAEEVVGHEVKITKRRVTKAEHLASNGQAP